MSVMTAQKHWRFGMGRLKMADYISRDEIFSVWRSMPRPASVSSLTDAINQTPAADMEPVCRWIPCSERLPESNGLYLAALAADDNDDWVDVLHFSDHKIVMGPYGGDEDARSVWWVFNDDYDAAFRCRNVTHWRPLPEPPKEGVADGTDVVDG